MVAYVFDYFVCDLDFSPFPGVCPAQPVEDNITQTDGLADVFH